MNPQAKRRETSSVVWSLMWAFAIIATAVLFKGSPSSYWIEAALVVGALAFVILRSQRPAENR
jgi:hypothetical protein